MSSTAALIAANALVSERERITTAFGDPEALLVMHFLEVRKRTTFKALTEQLGFSATNIETVLRALVDAGLVREEAGEYALSDAAHLRLSHRSFSLDFLTGSDLRASDSVENRLEQTYRLKEVIGRGATSFTFLAQHKSLKDRALKIFLPNTVTYERLAAAVEKRTKAIKDDGAIPDVLELGNVDIALPEGGAVILPCIVFNYVANAVTFAEFLKQPFVLNSTIFERFVERVGGALASIEAAGLQHGDLHEGNILVVVGTMPNQAKEFWVIDFIGAPSATSPELETPSDLENFRDHLIRAARVAIERYPGVPARVTLGDRVFRVVQGLRSGRYASFGELLDDYSRQSVDLPPDHFRAPLHDPFHGLRVEALDDPRLLYELFVPVPSRFDLIGRFGNTWISGPRGCGKSHYLRVLEFNPDVVREADKHRNLEAKLRELKYDFRAFFGVLFPCRPGEFKPFVPEAMGHKAFDRDTITFLKHILVLKIWNKTLLSLLRGLKPDPSVLSPPRNIADLVAFFERTIGPISLIWESDPITVFEQCAKACNALENSAIAVWNRPELRPNIRRLDERDLDGFFAILKQTFTDLAAARFFILVDDASEGSIHWEMQKILNSLVRSAQANHCFKITFDKYMYTLDTVDGRSIDPTHEVTYVDLGEISGKAQKRTRADQAAAVDLSQHMAQVVDLRLGAAGYQHSIQEILGPSQPAREFLAALRRTRRETSDLVDRPRAYYGGWNIVLSLSHGSVRTLLQLIEQIFRMTGADPHTGAISLDRQDAAVRSYSNRQYTALSMLPEDFKGRALGPKLQAVISAIGRISREYLLHYDTQDPHRWYETLSIERLDTGSLDEEAEKILFELVKYGLLLNQGVTFSRAQFGLTARYDLNKIFAPAFRITYRVRNHLYLSRELFAELLLRPDRFIARHRTKLHRLTLRVNDFQKSLFDGLG